MAFWTQAALENCNHQQVPKNPEELYGSYLPANGLIVGKACKGTTLFSSSQDPGSHNTHFGVTQNTQTDDISQSGNSFPFDIQQFTNSRSGCASRIIRNVILRSVMH